jgi:hypothetical protein
MFTEKRLRTSFTRTCRCYVGALALLIAASARPGAQEATTRAQELAAKGAEIEANLNSKWNVRIEAVTISLPEAKALSLLPLLSDPAKVDATYGQLLTLIEQKQATLLGYSVVHMLDGHRTVSESIVEKRYATEFEPPAAAGVGDPKAAQPAKLGDDSPIPTAFETRNTGVTLEAEASVSKNADWLYVNFVVQNVRLTGFDPYESAKTQSGKVVKIDQPRFAVSKDTMDVKLRNGQRCLVGVHKLPGEGDQLELTILQAVATPTK